MHVTFGLGHIFHSENLILFGNLTTQMLLLPTGHLDNLIIIEMPKTVFIWTTACQTHGMIIAVQRDSDTFVKNNNCFEYQAETMKEKQSK